MEVKRWFQECSLAGWLFVAVLGLSCISVGFCFLVQTITQMNGFLIFGWNTIIIGIAAVLGSLVESVCPKSQEQGCRKRV